MDAPTTSTCPFCSKQSGFYDLARLCCARRLIHNAAPVHRESTIVHVLDTASDEVADAIRSETRTPRR